MSRALDATPPLRVAGVLAGGLAAAVVIFSLGVMVGKRAAESSADVAALLAPLPAEIPLVPEPPPLSAPVPAEGLTFYDRLSGRAAPPPVDLPTGTPPPSPGSPGEAAGGAAAPPVPGAPPPARAASALADPAPPRAIAPAAPAPAATPPPRAGAEDALARVRRLTGRGGWAVQVAAVSQGQAAAAIAARYRGLGLEAATSRVTARGRTLHRVHVGSFASRDAAGRAAEILSRELGAPGSIPVRD